MLWCMWTSNYTGWNPLSTTTYTMIVGAICLIVVSLFTTNPVALPNIQIGAWGQSYLWPF
jgi:hypothetical protein